MTMYNIPLVGGPENFTIAIGPNVYRMRIAYANAPEGGWILDIADNTGNDLVCGIPLLPGQDLLAQYAYLGIPCALYVSGDKAPTYLQLGTDSKLYADVIDG